MFSLDPDIRAPPPKAEDEVGVDPAMSVGARPPHGRLGTMIDGTVHHADLIAKGQFPPLLTARSR